MHTRWQEYLIALCILVLGIAGVAAIWGPEVAPAEADSGAVGPSGTAAGTSGGG